MHTAIYNANLKLKILFRVPRTMAEKESYNRGKIETVLKSKKRLPNEF